MSRKKRDPWVLRRCVVCSKPTTRFYSIVSEPEWAPKIPFCLTHRNELTEMGLPTFLDKYDFVSVYALSLGFELTPYGFLRYKFVEQ